MKTAFELPTPIVPIKGSDEGFPVHRIYCVGRNYAAHAREMGVDPDREPPFFFLKPNDSIVLNNEDVPYPNRTENLHHEIELVVAIGKAGKNIPVDQANEYIFGYAVGNDITRRDLQVAMRKQGRPWDSGKSFDKSAAITDIQKVEDTGIIESGKIAITVNGETRQESDLTHLIWNIPEIIAEISTLWDLKPGDLIYTGTPEGVNAVVSGDVMVGTVEGLDTLTNKVV